jgi:hypothetical protein
MRPNGESFFLFIFGQLAEVSPLVSNRYNYNGRNKWFALVYSSKEICRKCATLFCLKVNLKKNVNFSRDECRDDFL